jgi:hypothetical protein
MGYACRGGPTMTIRRCVDFIEKPTNQLLPEQAVHTRRTEADL